MSFLFSSPGKIHETAHGVGGRPFLPSNPGKRTLEKILRQGIASLGRSAAKGMVLQALGCALIFGASSAGAFDASVKSVKGRVQAAAPGSKEFRPVREGEKLFVGSTVVCGAGSEAVIQTTPGAAIHVQENARFVLQFNEYAEEKGKIASRKTVVDLQEGTLSALISKNDPKTTRFEVRTPQGVAAARGTFFGVTVKEGEAFVAVKEGKVGVQQPEKDQKPSKPDEQKRADKQDLHAAR